MKIGQFSLWTTAAQARAMGCTNYARMFGVIPGFFGEIDGTPLWVPRSDALCWLEDVLSHMSAAIQQMKGDDPVFAFAVGREIAK